MIQATCVRGRLAAVALLILAFGVCAVAALQDLVVYTEARTSASTFRDRGTYLYTPTYVIYADRPRSARRHGCSSTNWACSSTWTNTRHAPSWSGRSTAVPYDAANDLKAFQNLLRTAAVHRTSKIIGIGAGATFVNNVIAKYAFAVAGILTGGTVDAAVTSSHPRSRLRACYGCGGRRSLCGQRRAAQGE